VRLLASERGKSPLEVTPFCVVGRQRLGLPQCVGCTFKLTESVQQLAANAVKVRIVLQVTLKVIGIVNLFERAEPGLVSTRLRDGDSPVECEQSGWGTRSIAS